MSNFKKKISLYFAMSMSMSISNRYRRNIRGAFKNNIFQKVKTLTEQGMMGSECIFFHFIDEDFNV